MAKSSSRSRPKRSASLRKEEGGLRYPSEALLGHDGKAQEAPRLEFDSKE